MGPPVCRWGILETAGIARKSWLRSTILRAGKEGNSRREPAWVRRSAVREA